MCESPTAIFYGYSHTAPLLKSMVSEAVFAEVMKKLDAGWIPGTTYGWAIGHCPTCGRIESRFYFTLKNGKRRYLPTYRCPLCSTRMKKVSWKIAFCLAVLQESPTETKPGYSTICPECGRELSLGPGEPFSILLTD